jgi:hypothetical protein
MNLSDSATKKRDKAYEDFGELNLGTPKTLADIADFMFERGYEIGHEEYESYKEQTKHSVNIAQSKVERLQSQMKLCEEALIFLQKGIEHFNHEDDAGQREHLLKYYYKFEESLSQLRGGGKL